MSEIEKLSKNGIGTLIGVISGKGGVGKSTTSVLLARALRAAGHSVGILDADITGPSIPRLLGLAGQSGLSENDRIIPLQDKQGISLVSVNMFLKDENDPVIWRGPLLANALKQFYNDTNWGNPDYLIVDFPPGTSDLVLTGFQSLPFDGVISVATPQDFVSMIVSKSVNMAHKSNVRVFGLIENMGTMVCPKCNEEFRLFKQQTDLQTSLGVPLLASFPWYPELAQAETLEWETLPEKLKDQVNAVLKALPGKSA